MITYTRNFHIKNSPGIELTSMYGLRDYNESEKKELSGLRKKFLKEIGIDIIKGKNRTWKVKSYTNQYKPKKILPKRTTVSNRKLRGNSLPVKIERNISGTRKIKPERKKPERKKPDKKK